MPYAIGKLSTNKTSDFCAKDSELYERSISSRFAPETNHLSRQPGSGGTDPLPFASYPSRGRELLRLARGGNCRHGYGLDHQILTGQNRCGYCGRDFTATYDTWLMMALDHVIPAKICEAMRLPNEWMNSHSNRVLSCSACNGFKNRWEPEVPPDCPATLDDFFDMRDAMFIERRTHIRQSHIEEKRFFDTRPWRKK